MPTMDEMRTRPPATRRACGPSRTPRRRSKRRCVSGPRSTTRRTPPSAAARALSCGCSRAHRAHRACWSWPTRSSTTWSLSVSNMNLYHIRDWGVIGLGQYAAVFAEPAFWKILGKTLLWTVVNVAFHVTHRRAAGGAAATRSSSRASPAWRVLLILPWALPQYITALTWRGMFNYEYGAVNLFLGQVSAPESRSSGSRSPTEAFIAAIITNIWLGLPLHDGRGPRRPAVDPGRALRGRRRGRGERVDQVLEHHGPAAAARS